LKCFRIYSTKAFKLFWIQIFYFFVSHCFSECFTLFYIISSYFCRRSNISVGGYPCGAAQFRNQIGIRGIGGNPFSRGGDSGSLIVTANSNQPVALLFAGRTDNSLTFANPIEIVNSRNFGLRY
ncbi:hypothetical protein PN432_09080, partial [Microcystis aeruginosa CS-579]|nr:hypothetical protein [Microcystis aeruginosa CS-579]